jgi:hypothetical protein
MASWKLNLTLQQAAVPPLAGFPVRNFDRSIIRSLTPQSRLGGTGNALAIAVHASRYQLTNDKEVKNGGRQDDENPKKCNFA